MHRVFGQKEEVIYQDRKGAYLIPIHGEEVGIVETAKGFFFLGGGINEGETEKECIIRECMEEAGYKVKVAEKVCSAETYCVHPMIGYYHPMQTYYLGELTLKTKEPIEADHQLRWINYKKLMGKMFLEMQNWALNIVFDKR